MMEILKTEQVDQLNADSKLVARIRVTWRAGDKDGPYADYFERDGFDPAVARAALERRAAELAALRGQ